MCVCVCVNDMNTKTETLLNDPVTDGHQTSNYIVNGIAGVNGRGYTLRVTSMKDKPRTF